MRGAEVLLEDLPLLAGRIQKGDLTCREVTRIALERTEKLNPRLNAFITLNVRAEEEAAALDRQGHRERPLFGVPVSIKDILFTRGMATSAGSSVESPKLCEMRDAAVVGRLRKAGAVIIGKNNLHEFAFGISNENEHFGPCRNPWNTACVPGGSSGGSAVAVAAGMVCGSIGTDTRGSIRIPAACCGVSGLKPTRGLVSTSGVIPLSRTLDHVGPLARSVTGVAEMMEVLAPDGGTGRYVNLPSGLPRGLRLGICPYYFRDLSDEV
ncbi:MAG: Asp-tRNA(Asn)/Glu-tRNA(Gln) amidotransferase GatCAB subunit A, partial [Acidobacteriota bacterium]